MVATAAAIASLIGTTVGVGSTIAGTMNRGNGTAQHGQDIALAQLQDARNNDQYQKALSTLITQRSVAGAQDEYGSGMEYDPATNTWRSRLGAQPKAVQDSADLAAISRNTTDLRQAQAANQQAAQRATDAGPVADTALRNLRDNRDMSSSTLAGLLQQRATDAARATFDPLTADTLRSYQRTGTAAAPVMAALGKQQFESLRDTLADSQIKALTGVDEINANRRKSLESSAVNTGGLATPQFQYPGITPSGNRDALANATAARAQQGGIGAVYGMGGVNAANTQSQSAYENLRKSLATPSNSLQTAGKEIGTALSNKSIGDNISTAYHGLFGPGAGSGIAADSSYQFDPSAFATAGGGGTNKLADMGFITSVNPGGFGS